VTTGLLKREIQITESRWETVELSEVDREALLAIRDEWQTEKDPRFFKREIAENGIAETTKILDVRTERGGKISVRVYDAIGAIDLPDSVLLVNPKIPIAHFNYIAIRALVPPTKKRSGEFGLATAQHFLELVCTWAVDSVEKILRDGLARGYVTTKDDVVAIRGRLDVQVATRRMSRGNFRLNCEYDEFSTDTALNRVLKHALKFIAGNPALSNLLQARSKRALKYFEGVGPMRHQDLKAKTSRNSQHYADALEFAKNVLEKSGRDLASGQKRSRSFLYKTPLLIEEGIRRIVEEGIAPTEVLKPKAKRLPTSDKRVVEANPDLGIGDSPFYTGDVKYKIQSQNWRRADLAQAVFFAVAYESPKALIIDFADENSVKNGTVAVSAIEVSPISWDVSNGISPDEARDKLISEIAFWLKESTLVFTPALKAS
jgi:5-methylcytosine-specific restriction enzyme subunit McrC